MIVTTSDLLKLMTPERIGELRILVDRGDGYACGVAVTRFYSRGLCEEAIHMVNIYGGLSLAEDDAIQPNAKLELKPHFRESEKRGDAWIVYGTVIR